MIGRMRRVLLLLALGGCDILFRIDRIPANTGDGGSIGDGAPPRDGSSGSCAGGVLVGLNGAGNAGLVQVCVTSTAAVHLSTLINTDSMCPLTLAQTVSPDLCVYTGMTIDTTANFRVIGSRALVLAATGVITIANTIDLSGGNLEPGAGGDTANCDGMAGVNSVNGGGGGGGGSFQTAGGAGNNAGGSGGTPGPLGTVTHVRGGCRGGLGGGGGTAGNAPRGHSGGAIYLASAAKIVVTGGINACGGGGGHGTAATDGSGGGGGGASGGLIAFDAPQLDATGGMIWANGGGGGGGGGAGATRTDGVTGYESTSPTMAGGGGGGGDGTPTGGDGGMGPLLLSVGGAGHPAVSTAGAGGGAGGQGFILFYGTASNTGVTGVSPPLTKM